MSDEIIDRHDVHSRIDRIEVTLNHAVDAIEKMAGIVNKPQDVKWGPILTAVSLLFLAGGAYTNLITFPLTDRADMLEMKLNQSYERELELQRDLGRIEGMLGINNE